MGTVIVSRNSDYPRVLKRISNIFLILYNDGILYFVDVHYLNSFIIQSTIQLLDNMETINDYFCIRKYFFDSIRIRGFISITTYFTRRRFYKLKRRKWSLIAKFLRSLRISMIFPVSPSLKIKQNFE